METTHAYLRGLRSCVSAFGRPVAFYSDRHSIFCKHDPENPEPPERAFQTLQDRLVKALRLAHIDTIEAANALLPAFIEHYNARFAKAPRCPEDAHRRLNVSAEQLVWITSEQHTRTLSKSLSCQFRGRLLLIQTQGAPAYHLRGARITVCDDGANNSIVLLYQGKPLPYRVFVRHDLPERIADDKTVDACVEAALRRQSAPAWTPPANHPWRKPFSRATAA